MFQFYSQKKCSRLWNASVEFVKLFRNQKKKRNINQHQNNNLKGGPVLIAVGQA